MNGCKEDLCFAIGKSVAASFHNDVITDHLHHQVYVNSANIYLPYLEVALPNTWTTNISGHRVYCTEHAWSQWMPSESQTCTDLHRPQSFLSPNAKWMCLYVNWTHLVCIRLFGVLYTALWITNRLYQNEHRSTLFNTLTTEECLIFWASSN